MPMSYSDALMRYSRTPGAAQSVQNGNLAAPNAGAIGPSIPMPNAPSPSDQSGGLPPEIAALLSQFMGANGGPDALAPPPPPSSPSLPASAPPDQIVGAQPPPDPMQMLQAVAEQAFQAGAEQGAMAAQAAAPNPQTAPAIGAPPVPVAAPPMGLGPDFRSRFMQQNGRFPTPTDISDEAYSRDFLMRTGRVPTKMELLARLGPPSTPQGISEFA